MGSFHCYVRNMQPVAGASRTNCKHSASQINKVQHPPLTVHANTWLISLFNLWCSGVFYTHLWILPVLVSHQNYPCPFQHRCFRGRWFEGGTEAVSRFCKGEGGDEQHRAQPSLSHFILFSSNGMKKNLYFGRPFPCLHPLSWKTGPCLHWNCLSEGKLEVSAMDSSCCLHGSVKSTNVPTTAPVAHSVRISNATRDMALEHLLKYLPELWLRLPQNLRRIENCLRGGTWKQRGHFSEYGLTGWKTKPHFTLTHSHEGSCKAWRFPASAHPYATTHLSGCVRNTRDPER